MPAPDHMFEAAQGDAQSIDDFKPFEDEQILQAFRPKFTLFLQRIVLVGMLTTLGFGLVPGLDIGFAQQVGLALIIVVIWAFVFDEWQEWRDRRGDRWVLTSQRLVFSNSEDAGLRWLSLSDLVTVRRFLWWSLRLKSRDGRVTVMAYVGPVSDIRKQILTARQAHLHG